MMEIKIPLECFTLITGVSGSGKSSLIKQAIKPFWNRYLMDKV